MTMFLSSSARQMLLTAATRAFRAVLVVLATTAIVTVLLDLAPGGPEKALSGSGFATESQLAALREQYGLNDPLLQRYLAWLGTALQGDLGRSFASQQQVTQSIKDGLLVTGPLVLVSFALIAALGTAFGFVAANREGGLLDRGLTTGALVGASAPVFVVAIGLLVVFGVQLGWVPVFGTGEGFGDRARHLILPIAAMTFAGTAAMLQVVRTRVQEVMREDYVTFARARGLRSRHVHTYVLRNSAVQVVTRSGTIIVGLVSFAMLIEETFGLDGLGTLLLKASRDRDVPTVQGVILVITLFVVAVNIAVDALYPIIDPRTVRRVARSTRSGGHA